MLRKVDYGDLRMAGIKMFPAAGSIIDFEGRQYKVEAYHKQEPWVYLRELARVETKIDRWRSTLIGNGFPKGGTHLLLQAIRPIYEPCKALARGASSYDMGWGPKASENWIISQLRMLQANECLGGHLIADDRRVVNWMAKHQVPMVFIYRDLRDVVVSYAHHVEKVDNKRLFHTDAEVYQALPTHEDRIAAAITGIGPYRGIGDYWSEYQGWLDDERILKVRYEDMRWNPLQECLRILRYIDKCRQDEHAEADLVRLSQWMAGAIMPATSPTFRRGIVGGWHQEFTSELVGLFKEHSGHWLIRMGYEKDYTWQRDESQDEPKNQS